MPSRPDVPPPAGAPEVDEVDRTSGSQSGLGVLFFALYQAVVGASGRRGRAEVDTEGAPSVRWRGGRDACPNCRVRRGDARGSDRKPVCRGCNDFTGGKSLGRLAGRLRVGKRFVPAVPRPLRKSSSYPGTRPYPAQEGAEPNRTKLCGTGPVSPPLRKDGEADLRRGLAVPDAETLSTMRRMVARVGEGLLA